MSPPFDAEKRARVRAEELAELGLLTERQALAYALRRIEGVPRAEAAAIMGIEVTTLDDRRREAEAKIEAASDTLARLGMLD